MWTIHFPIDNKHGMYFLKMYQHRSYVIALERAADVHGMYISAEKGGYSFRNYGDLLLLGGGAHRTGKTGGNWQELRDLASRYYPDSKERYAWATQDCMTLDGVPYIGRYAKHMPDCYVETTAFLQWMGGTHQSADHLKETLPASGLCFKMEPCGAHMGLPLSRFTL